MSSIKAFIRRHPALTFYAGKFPRDAEPLEQGLVTTPDTRGETISQAA
jgi:hypothetical protein